MAMLVLLSGLFCFAVVVLVQWMRSGKIKGLPEPAGNYAFGHVFQIGGNLRETILCWKKMVGPVFQLRFFKVRVVVFNDKESITKVCSMPAASGRAHIGPLKLMLDILGGGVATGEGRKWTEQRRFILKSLKTFGCGRPETERGLKNEISDALREWENLDGTPFKLQGCNTKFVFNALWGIISSKRVEHSVISQLSRHIQIMSQFDTFAEKVSTLSPDIASTFSNVVEKKIEYLRTVVALARESVIDHSKDRVPNEPRDIVDQMLDKMEITTDVSSAYHKNNLDTGFALGDLLMATVDTTRKSVEWFMFYLARNTEVAYKLHEEIDQVFGDDLESWPSLTDREKMPYTQACILEALRLASMAPLGIPHRAIEDFEFNGALIPKGTVLIMNQYAVHHDSEVWEHPGVFQPSRFLTLDGRRVDPNVKSKIVPFGVGRRVCPGYFVAMDFMFLFVANAYRKFRFEMTYDAIDHERKFDFVQGPPENVELRAITRVDSQKKCSPQGT